MDTSGSMNDADPTHPGQTKLDTAKQVVNGLLGELKVPFGLITYPSGATGEELPEIDSCPAGRVLLSPNKRELGQDSAVINAMVADGNTPTGPALQGAAHWLAQRGFRNATVVLITDGEENCGPPACDVAQRVRDSGIELTVHGIGLTEEETVNSSLRCIADATGGTAVSGIDVDQLKPEITRAVGGSIKVVADAPKKLQPLGAAVKNQAIDISIAAEGRLILNAQVSVKAINSNGAAVRVYKPVRAIGSIPSGSTVKLKVPLQPGVGDVGKIQWQVTVYERVPIVEVALPGGPVTRVQGNSEVVKPEGEFLLGPIIRDSKNVVVMGDSYSSGENAPPYILGSGDRDWENRCHRSPYTHGAQLFPHATILACSGAVTADFLDYQITESGWGERKNKAVVPQLRALEELEQAPGLVIMSIGGNDAGFGDLVTGSLTTGYPSYLFGMWGSLDQQVSHDLDERIARVLLEVDARVNSVDRVKQRAGKIAPILVLPYPHALHGLGSHKSCAWSINELEKRNMVAFQFDLNKEVEEAVIKVSSRPIYYVQDVARAFAAQSPCGDNAPLSVVGILAGGAAVVGGAFGSSHKQELFHPNARGYRLEARAIQDWSWRQGLRDPQSFEPAALQPAEPYSLDGKYERVLMGKLEELGFRGASSRERIVLRCEARRGYSPEDLPPDIQEACMLVWQSPTVYFEVRSDPVSLGYYPGGPDVEELHVRLPQDLPPGNHTLIAYGRGEDGKPAKVEIPIYVPSAREQMALFLGVHAVAAAVVAAMLLGVAAVLGWFKRRRKAKLSNVADS
ncbi:VWA domain-containing protein [Buchananella felis]|uniref:VWA domain-containing protein n=1 Tax=Buchananella felis TaxID=3231492 RepID=UPI0035294A94